MLPPILQINIDNSLFQSDLYISTGGKRIGNKNF